MAKSTRAISQKITKYYFIAELRLFQKEITLENFILHLLAKIDNIQVNFSSSVLTESKVLSL